MSWHFYGDFENPAEKRARVLLEILERRKKGEPFEQLSAGGSKRGVPATTFWGRAWCENLESYSDYESRLPRGRAYLRKGNVYDLEITPGKISARVTGSEIYDVEVRIDPLSKGDWKSLRTSLAGQVTNLVALLSGHLGEGVMAAVTDRKSGLFPSPKKIHLQCSCPDWAEMCKHVAAVLYGIGVKLDREPQMLFELREVDHTELIEQAAESAANVSKLTAPDASTEVLEAGELSELFGIEITDPEAAFGK